MANENGWGDGASNNNIGWGQGAINNAISWGAIHSLSAAGLTDIVGQTFQPESVAYFTAIEDAGGTLTDNVKAEFDAFVVREKDAGRWDKIKRLYPFLGGKINSAVIDAKTLTTTDNVNFSDVDVDNLTGLQGDGSTKFLKEKTALNTIIDSINKAQIGTITRGAFADSGVAKFYSDCLDTSVSPISMFGLDKTNTDVFRSYIGTTSFGASNSEPATSDMSIIGARYSSTSLYTIVNGVESVQVTGSNTSVASTRKPYYFGRNINDGASASSITSQKIASFFISQFDTLQETKDFTTSYKTFINNIITYAALMDSYSGAAAAYSLRKLYSSYEGSAINVRRSSDNATQDIGFDGYVLDTASLLSFVGAGDGYVTTWYDQSGNGNDATQTTASSQPMIVSSGSLITENGKVTINFDGVTDFLQSDYYVNLNNLSFWSVTTYKSNTSRGISLMISDGTGAILYLDNGRLNLNTTEFRYKSNSYFETYTYTDNTQIHSLTTDSINAVPYRNGILKTSFPKSTLTSQQKLTIGSYYSGIVAANINAQELILYEVDQSSNRTAIESLINSYYSVY